MKFLKFLISKAFWLNLAVIVVLTLVAVLGTFWWLKVHTNHNEYITLDNLEGRTLEETATLLEDRQLNYVIQDSLDFDPSRAPLSVVTQNPNPGEKVKSGRTIYLYINPSKPALKQVPDLAGNSSFTTALLKLKNFGFELGEVYMVPSEAENAVLMVMLDSVPLPKDTLLPAGSKLDLVVGGGEGNVKIKVPCLIGETLDVAEALILAEKLSIGSQLWDSVGLIDPTSAVVYKQLPDCGDATIRQGEGIDLFIAQELPDDVLEKLQSLFGDSANIVLQDSVYVPN